MYKKVFLAILLAILQLFSLVMPVYAANVNFDFSRANFIVIEKPEDGEGTLNMLVVDKDGNEVSQKKAGHFLTGGMMSAAGDATFSYPASYDLRNVDGNGTSYITSPKHQGYTGFCWAFSAMASAESNILKNGLYFSEDWMSSPAGDSKELALSPVHLGQTAFYSSDIPGTEGDYFYSEYKGAIGGNDYIAAEALAAGRGAQLWKETPFSYVDYKMDGAQTDVSYFALKNYSMIDMDYEAPYSENNAKNIKDIKGFIINNGAAVINYYPSTVYTDANNYAAYSNAYEGKASHASVIVGWDDNFSFASFSDMRVKPQKNGAWLVRDTYGDARGDGGYFWLSYYDNSITQVASVEMAARSVYDNNYQHTGTMGIFLFPFKKTANVFTAKGGDTLSAIGLTTYYNNVYYSVDVYRALSGDEPESGTLFMSTSGVLQTKGYHTIDILGDEAFLPGEKFSVVVELRTANQSGELVNMFFELNGAEYWSGTYINYECTPGETYVYDEFYVDGDGWLDVTELKSAVSFPYDIGNAFIRAYTTDGDNTLDKSELLAAITMAEESAPTNDLASKIRSELFGIYERDLSYAKELAQSETAMQFELDNAAKNLTAVVNMLARDRVKEIASAAELYKYAKEYLLPENGCIDTVKLTDDIVLNPKSAFVLDDAGHIRGLKTTPFVIAPIGTESDPFSKTFDGNGKSISGLCITGNHTGLIDTLTGEIKNLTIKDAFINAKADSVGGLAGSVRYGSKISNIRAENVTQNSAAKFSGIVAGELNNSLHYVTDRAEGAAAEIDGVIITNSLLIPSGLVSGGVVGRVTQGAVLANASFSGNMSKVISLDSTIAPVAGSGYADALAAYRKVNTNNSSVYLNFSAVCEENTLKDVKVTPNYEKIGKNKGVSALSYNGGASALTKDIDGEVFTLGEWSDSGADMNLAATVYDISEGSLDYNRETNKVTAVLPESYQGTQIFAVRYNSSGELVGVVPYLRTMSQGTWRFSADDFDVQSGETVKIMLWNGSEMKPLCRAYDSSLVK